MTCRAVVVVFLFLASLCIPSRAHGQEREVDPRPAAAPEKKETKAPEEKKHEELELGALGGVGFPHPLAIEGVVRVHEMVMLGVEYGVMPKITINDVSTSMWSLAADARVFPFKGAFFIGLRAGYQSLSAAATLTADNIGSYTESMDVKTWFLNPRIGFLWVWKPIALGLDAGVQLPISTTVSRSTLLALASPSLDSQITRAADTLGKTPLPTIDLLRIGVMF